jgi:sugar phosphate isomerase/epimerase
MVPDGYSGGNTHMRESMNRRDFLKTTAALGAGVSLAGLPGPLAAAAEAVKSSSPTAKKIGWVLGCQQYTFRSMSFYEAIEKIAALGMESVEPAFFLPLRKDRPELKTNEALPADERKELKKRLSDLGIRMNNFYGDLGNDAGDCRKKLDFAKEMGVETFVAEPPAEAFDVIEKLCDEYKINLAVHNHPRSPQSKYWDPENVLAVCKGRSKRIGSCSDTGHWVRSGLDPVQCLKKMEGRIITLHLKDVIESGKPEARDVPLGTGKAKYGDVLAEVHRQGFKGVLVVEYEHESPKLVEEVAECIAFVEKTAKSMAK